MNTMTPKQVMWIRVMTSTWRHFLVAGHTCPALSLLLPASWVKTKFALADNVDWLAGFHSSLFPISIPRDAKNCIFWTCLQLRCWIGITFHLLDMFWKDLEDENEVRTILLFFFLASKVIVTIYQQQCSGVCSWDSLVSRVRVQCTVLWMAVHSSGGSDGGGGGSDGGGGGCSFLISSDCRYDKLIPLIVSSTTLFWESLLETQSKKACSSIYV